MDSSFYKAYMKETYSREVIEDETGFISFSILPDAKNVCYIVDIYISPEFRKKGHTNRLEAMAIEWAKQQGCDYVLGSVNMKSSTPERSMVELIKAGYKLSHVDGVLIYFIKDIQGA